MVYESRRRRRVRARRHRRGASRTSPHDRVLVTPAPGRPGQDAVLARRRAGPAGRAGPRARRVRPRARRADATRPRLRRDSPRPASTSSRRRNLVRYLDEQREATGVLPDDRTIVVERFRDELGDWRVCIHSPFGAPRPRAVGAGHRDAGARAAGPRGPDDVHRRRHRRPPARGRRGARRPSRSCSSPRRSRSWSSTRSASSALFASRFRESAGARPAAAAPPARPPHAAVAAAPAERRRCCRWPRSYPPFPIVLETYRECLQDVFDLPGAGRADGRRSQRREVRVVEVDTPMPSPFASSLLFGYIAAFMYEGDAPLAERRAQALTLDRARAGRAAGAERAARPDRPGGAGPARARAAAAGRRPQGRADADDLHDALRALGDLTRRRGRGALARAGRGAGVAAPSSRATRRAMPRPRRRRGAVGRRWRTPPASATRSARALPVGVPGARSSSRSPIRSAIWSARFARDRTGRSRADEPRAAARARRRGGRGRAASRSRPRGRVVEGEFRPGGAGREWIDAEVLRRLRRRSLAALPQGGRAGPAGGAGAVPARLAGRGTGGARAGRRRRAVPGDRAAPGRAAPGLGARAAGAAVAPARATRRPCSTSCAPPARWCGPGAGALGGDDGWVVLCHRRTGPVAPARRRSPVELSPEPRRSVTRSPSGARCSSARWSTPSVGRTTARSSWRCGSWCGPGWSRTTRSAPLRALVAGAGRRRSAVGVRGAGAGRVPVAARAADGAGRWSLLPASARPTPRAGCTPRPSSCSTGTAS